MRGKEVTSETVTQKVADGSVPEGFAWTETTVYESSAGTQMGALKGPWGVCQLCGYTAPMSELNELDGKLFCSKYECYQSTIYEANREDL